jgi:peroxiredoxin
MAIKVGDKIPSVALRYMNKDGKPTPITTDEIFKGKKVVLFALPGAFTPTCSAAHLPGFVVNADAIKKRKVDRIVCLSVNDAFVMHAWGKSQNVDDNIMMLADGSAEFTKAVGLDDDRTAQGMGVRSRRYAMIVDNGVVKALNVEAPGEFKVSSAEAVLKLL